jgi:hypothetical protein
MAQEILPQYVDRGKDCKNCDILFEVGESQKK